MRESATKSASPVQTAVSEASEALHADGDFASVWGGLERAGMTGISIPAEAGGNGGSLSEAAGLLRAAGYYGLPLPVAETALLAGWALSASGIPLPRGPLTAVPVRGEEIELRRQGQGWTLHGSVRRVPWAREAGRLVVVDGSENEALVAVVSPVDCEVTPGDNLAGEPRDEVRLDGVRAEEVAPAGEGVRAEALRLRGALARTIALAGALDRALELSVEHAGSREQFGRSIGRFQAVQQQLALLAGEVAAVDAAADAAVQAAASVNDIRVAWPEIAAAKARASAAAGTAASISHQVHGAVGFTDRHPLHRTTLRLWAWREEFGNEAEWNASLGKRVAALGGEGLWDAVIEPGSHLEEKPERQEEHGGP